MKKLSVSKFIGLLMIMVLTITACGGSNTASNGGDNGGDSAQSADAEPTRTPFPTFAYVAPTTPPIFESESTEEADSEPTEETEETIELDPTMVERGLGRYEALDCASCHGEGGVGTDDGSSLIGLALSEDEFTTFMRSGGEIGTSHQYSTDRLSQNGSRNLYMYLLSLAQSDS